jgi:glycerol-3-phosphate dehydrogenase
MAMRRDLSRLSAATFDLLVIGAGIHGACAAWDATLRGLSVALVDQGDFGAVTSANSLGIVHGGLRYLGRGDIARMLESIRERTALLRIAPALVQPLPVLVPTYAYGVRSRPAYRAALAVNDLVSAFRNRGLDRPQFIPRGRVVSRDECLSLFAGFDPEADLSGGALWYDGQLTHPARLTLSFVQSAADRGAAPANYLRVENLRIRNGAIEGANVRDQLTGGSFAIQARTVLVAAGHWTDVVIATAGGVAPPTPDPHALGVNVIIGRRLADVGVGVQARSGRDRDPIAGGRRYLFLAPHGRTTMLGTWYAAANDAAPERQVELGARTLIEELNEACPALGLGPADVVRRQWGWLPLKAGVERGRRNALAERPRVVNHGRKHGIARLISVEGVKYTTARRVAQHAVDQVFHALGRQTPACRTAATPLNTGTGLRPDIGYVVREEMAIRLTDLVFRRTDLGAAPGPDRPLVEAAARVMGAVLGWDAHHREAEIGEVMRQAEVPGPALEAVG